MDIQKAPLIIRPQNRAEDLAAIGGINAMAFGKGGGTPAFQALRTSAHDIVSLVAERQGEVIGHVFFSPVTLESDPPLQGMGLGELAVAPDWQRQGVGAALTEAGIAALRGTRCPFVIVIGLPAYYPRLGFEAGSKYGLKCQWDVPPESFMVRVLDPGALGDRTGTVRYRDV
ncbi:MAG: GNAT family N-acetyltransferase [Gammaproteobacteria bacterium]